MKPLDWRMRNNVLAARPSEGLRYEVTPMAGGAWEAAAHRDDAYNHLARGSLPECLEACEKSKAMASVTEMRARTANGQSLTPVELGLPTELPDVTLRVSMAHVGNLRCLVNETFTEAQLNDAGLSSGRDCAHFIRRIGRVGDAYEVTLAACPRSG